MVDNIAYEIDHRILPNVTSLEIKFRGYIFHISKGNLCDPNINLSANKTDHCMRLW